MPGADLAQAALAFLLAHLDLHALAVLAPIVMLASLVLQSLGFGGGLVAVPLATLALDLRFVLPVLVLLEAANTGRLVSTTRRHARLDEALPLVALSLAGTLVGARLLVDLPDEWLMLAMALFISGFLLYSWLHRPASHPIGRGWIVPAGTASGFCSSMFGMGGPPYLVYLTLRQLPMPALRATLGVIGVFNVAWRVLAFALAGLFANPTIVVTAALLLPVALVSMSIAERVRGRIDVGTFRFLTYAVLVLASVTLAWRAVTGLA